MDTHRSSSVLLRVGPTRWTAFVDSETLAEIPISDGKGWEEGTADRLSKALEGRVRGPLVVAFDSQLCLPFEFSTASVRQARNREVVAYQAEESLPIAAEELASDYVAQGVNVFGVGVDRHLLENLVGDVVDAGFDVVCVAPIAVLAASQLSHEDKEVDSSWWIGTEGIDQLAFDSSGPTHWRTLPREPAALESALAAQQLAGQVVDIEAVVATAGIARPCHTESATLIEVDDKDPRVGLATRASERLCRGQSTTPINLLRGLPSHSVALRDPLRWDRIAVVASLVLLLLSAAAWRAAIAIAAENELQQIADAEADWFRQALPEARVPRGIRSRLKSELRRLNGTRADLSGMPEHTDAATRLQTVLGALPAEMRFRVLELRIESDRLFMVGEARSYSDADQIAASLRRAGFLVDPPSSRQLAEKGIEFRLSAEQPTDGEAEDQDEEAKR